MTDPDAGRPRYRLLRDVLAREIVEGRWRPGDRIPKEIELKLQNKVALGTLQRALDLLEDEGFIERQQGRGTYVRRPNFQQYAVRSIQCYGSAGDPRTPRAEIVERLVVAASSQIAEALHLQPGIDVIRIKRLRTDDGRAVLAETIWLEKERFLPILTMVDTTHALLYPVYEALCGAVVARIRETLGVTLSNTQDCQTFDVATPTPMADIQRTALGYDNKPIEFRCTRGPANNLRYTIDIF